MIGCVFRCWCAFGCVGPVLSEGCAVRVIADARLVSTLPATNKLFFTVGSRGTASTGRCRRHRAALAVQASAAAAAAAAAAVVLVMVIVAAAAGTSTEHHRPGSGRRRDPRRRRRKCPPRDVTCWARGTPHAAGAGCLRMRRDRDCLRPWQEPPAGCAPALRRWEY